MKKLFLLLSIVFVCFSCEQKGQYDIEGTATSELEGKYVYLIKNNDAGIEKCDTAIIKDGKFSFKGVQETPELFYIQAGDDEKMIKQALLLEPGKIVITISDQLIVNGTTTNDAYQQYLNEQTAIDRKLNEIAEKSDPENEPGIKKEYDSIYDEKRASYAKYFAENINNPLGAQEFKVFGRRLNSEQLADVLSKGNDAFKASKVGLFYQERLDAVQKTAVGQKFVDIVSKDPSGKQVSLSDYAGKGKYVLVDFWASWCPPCRKEMPMIVELYKQYKNKKFEIVGYSLDKDIDAWTKGLNDLNMTWPQMSDVNYWQSEPVKNYAVQGIPFTVLIDPAGVIIAKGLLGEELKSKLEEVLK